MEQGDDARKGDDVSEDSGYNPDDPRFAALPEEAKCVWEQCTWVGEDELSGVLDHLEKLGLDPCAIPGTRQAFLRVVRDLVPNLTKDEHAELREISKSKETHSVATVMQILANKRLLQVVTTDEREDVYELFPNEAEDCPWDQYTQLLRKHGLKIPKEQESLMKDSPGVLLHDALATFYQLKVARAPQRYPSSCVFQNKMRELFLAHAHESKPAKTSDEEVAEAIAGEELDAGRGQMVMAPDQVLSALNSLGWFNDVAQSLQDDIKQELKGMKEVDFGLFLGYAELVADPDAEAIRLADAEQVLKQAFLKQAEVLPDGTRFLRLDEMKKTFEEVGVSYCDEDLDEVRRICAEEGLSEGFPGVDAWWDVLRQVINPGSEGVQAVMAQFWDEQTQGKRSTVPIEKVVKFCEALDVEPPIHIGPHDVENAKRVLNVRTQLSRSDFESVVHWFVDGSHVQERSSPEARSRRREQSARDVERRSQRREFNDTEPEGYGMFAFVLLIVVALLIGVGYVLVYGNPLRGVWQQFTGILEHDPEYQALDL